MFTGLVEELGKIRVLSRGANSIRLTVSAEKVLSDIKLGDSIAVDGACLTVVEFGSSSFTVDVMPETFDRTTLPLKKSGDAVNLERTLRVGDRLGGHIVSGHIDAVATLVSVTPRGNANILRVKLPLQLAQFLIPQGSVALDGVSLTIVDCKDDWFDVSLIPHTWDVTILAGKRTGDKVNVETDVLGKYIYRMTQIKTEGMTGEKTIGIDFLTQHGFLD